MTLGAKIGVDDVVEIPTEVLTPVKQRGGSGISRLKIDSIFFVKVEDAQIVGELVKFPLSIVRQLRPTIAAKMFFDGLRYDEVKLAYFRGA